MVARELRVSVPVDGLLRGLLGGVVMILALMIHSAAVGLGVWLPARAIAASVLGPLALVEGTAAVALGIAIHFIIAAAWGIPFAYLTSRKLGSLARSIAIGSVYGLFVLLAMSSLVLPWADPTLRARADLAPGIWLVAHLLYGIVVATGPRSVPARWHLPWH